ncbi:MAG: polysaccharide deacetylase family protein [Burkholderiales bacterium]|nr:MAG: polysaccharide deacetylase family protein [Burkholderiales bacterium]
MRSALRRTVVLAAASLLPLSAGAASCPGGTVYLTLDTGNMREAERISGILRKHDVRVTFFLANEKTPDGDHSLDERWAGYWRERAREGHAFGSHTFDHVYFRGVAADGSLTVRPQFGAQAGRTLQWSGRELCTELDRVGTRFKAMTGQGLEPLWRAPGGKAPRQAMAAAKACGYAHVHWAPAGFLGDELPSETHPNDRLLAQALAGIRGGDILMAHLGIWSRRDPYAPMLDPLIGGLKARGMCFATLREHPDYRR